MSTAAARFLRWTLSLLLGGGAALAAVVAASVWLSGQTARHAADVARERATFAVYGDLLSAMVDAETAQRGYLLTQDDDYLRPYRGARGAVEAGLARLDVLGGGRYAARARTLRDLAIAKLEELDETIALAGRGALDQALALVRTDRGLDLMEQLRTVLGQARAEGDAEINGKLGMLTGNAQWQVAASLLGAILVLLFAAGAIWIVIRYTRALVAARQEVEALNQSLESRVAERTAALSRANDEIQRFAYIVSHDLRAPLVNIMGFTSELEVATGTLKAFVTEGREPEAAQRAVEEEVPEAVHFIRASTGKMDRLIAAILKLSRLGRSELRPERVELRPLVEQVVASLQHQIDAGGITVAIGGGLPAIVSDRVALEQILSNLIENAVKYLQPGRPGRIAIEGRAGRDRVTVTVTDNGRGIAPRDQERVFELFRRAGVQDQPGEGIGLAHVRALARRLGGDVTLSSTIGEGTSFQIDLPKYTSKENEPAQ
jgi:signal transduction histidine kinase